MKAWNEMEYDQAQTGKRDLAGLSIAVLIPCYNEEVAITKVVKDFQSSLPIAEIYVYDNNSKDHTVQKAKAAGAIVRSVTRQGKGHVVARCLPISTRMSTC